MKNKNFDGYIYVKEEDRKKFPEPKIVDLSKSNELYKFNQAKSLSKVFKNFDHYESLQAAIKAYDKYVEPLYNVHEGVSAGRFLRWLYKQYDPSIDIQKSENVHSECGSSECDRDVFPFSDDTCCKKPSIETEIYESTLKDAIEMSSALKKIQKAIKKYLSLKDQPDCKYDSKNVINDICEIFMGLSDAFKDKQYIA